MATDLEVLRIELELAEAERNRLRAVVETAGTETGAIADITDSEIAADRSRNLSQWLQRQLDVSPDNG